MRRPAVLLAAAVLVVADVGGTGKSPPVNVALRSSWPAPPAIPELLETLALENPGAFFTYADLLASSPVLQRAQREVQLAPSKQAITQTGLQIAVENGLVQDPGALERVKMQLGLHSATPKLEAFYAYYRDQGFLDAQTSASTPCGGASWVDWYGEVVCDVDRLAHLTGKETIDSATNSIPPKQPKILTFDHIYPPPEHILARPPHTAIFYAAWGSHNFMDLHTYLLKVTNVPNPRVEYVFRHVPPPGVGGEKNYLSGYGVALDLKKMDYLAVDDRGVGSQKSASSSTEEDTAEETNLDPVQALLQAYPDTSESSSAALTEEELNQLGAQSIHLITTSPNPLSILETLSQNLPKYAHALSKRVHPIPSPLSEELTNNSNKVPQGVNILWLNGLQLDYKDVQPMGVLDLLERERGVMRSLTSKVIRDEGRVHGVGLSREQALDLLAQDIIAQHQRAQIQGGDVGDGIFDASDRIEGGGVVFWWNDFEKDSKYARWNPSLYGLLQPTYPGQTPRVRQNLLNVILILDLSQNNALNFLSGPMATIIARDYPFRFGLVPVVETVQGRMMARLFGWLTKNFGRKRTLTFLKSLGQGQRPPHDQTETVEWHHVHVAYDMLIEKELGDNPTFEAPEFADIVDGVVAKQAKERKAEREALAKAQGDAEKEKEEKKTEEEEEAEEENDGGDGLEIEKIDAYTKRLAARLENNRMGHVFFNGKHFDMGAAFLGQLQAELNVQLSYFQEKIYSGVLSDQNKPDSFENYFYDLPTTSKRRNKYIFPSNNPSSVNAAGSLRVFNLVDVSETTGLRMGMYGYLYPDNKEEVAQSLFVIADLDSQEGLQFVKEAIDSLKNENTTTRISFIHNPTNPIDPLTSSSSSHTAQDTTHRPRASWLLSHLISQNLLSSSDPTTLLIALGMPSHPVTLTEQEEAIEKLTGGVSIGEMSKEIYGDYVRSSRLFGRKVGFGGGEMGLILNGRLVGPIESGGFKAEDFKALEDYEFKKRTEVVAQALKDVIPSCEGDRFWFAEAASMASSVISWSHLPDPSEVGLLDAPPRPRQRTYRLLDSEHTSFTHGDQATALYHIAAVLDPLSETAQKWSSLLKWIANIPDVFIQVYMNPGIYREMPLKRFYRYNLLSEPSFDTEGNEVPAGVTFDNLPTDPIYTLAMDVPTSWLVRPREALYDLDNIQLNKLFPGDTSVDAVFELDYLVIDGHARETVHNNAPRGVQLQLSTSTTSDSTSSETEAVDDTQVVANLGYFQFKAKPGVFRLDVRKGRSAAVYHLESAGNEGWDSPGVDVAGNEITLTSFAGLTLYPRLGRNRGMEDKDVLQDNVKEQGGGGFFGNISSKVKSFFGKQERLSTDLITVKPQAEINIFTVASGLLYERFVGIMILSVLRNTNSTVKFWFIENFLSPAFLEFIPHMAEKYNFQYELVTYKWPSWLRAQKEKQRIIWAYKILFLDVLFPMDLKKVIFVDADQIVRADLKELVDLDLHGAPYGYTPMGDDNTDMEGFRFWKTGYWKEFLEGKPYHISALYVIDLVKFRQLAAGDILRGQYQQLSADPNSLANLDQDLPNNLQKQVPIYSLHEDWLWCETWCSKDRLHRAKTIDLCQNPLTKEPKLARARQIPEWEEYDAEIARFTRNLAAEGKIHSKMATADANVLAGGSTPQKSESEAPDAVVGGTGDGAQSSSGHESSPETHGEAEDLPLSRDEL